MIATALSRELRRDGTVVLKAGRASFRYRRPRPGTLIQIHSDAELFEARKGGGGR